MPISVMAGLVPAILVVRLARGPNALPTGAPTVSESAAPLDDVDGRDKPGHDDGGGRCHSCATRNDGGGRRRSIDSASPAPASSGADSSFRNTEFVLSRQSWSKCQIEENSSSRSARARSRPEPQKALDTQMRRSVGQEGNFPLRKPLIIRETRKQSRPLFGSASGLGTRRPIYARCAAIYGVRLFTGARPA